ncbi:MAG: MFS transporter, partial [Clostridia bacterium]|nr:MFS transporter [Clostridia bacterium]
MEKKRSGFSLWFLVLGLGLIGQICWNMENQWFNTFVYAKIAKDPSIITGMLSFSALATTFSTFFFGTLSDRLG